MKTLAIIQARMGSTRLPGKVLADVQGRPMLRWLLDRLQAVKEVDEIVVATTTKPEDDQLEQWILFQPGMSCFRGSELDVLDRFYRCAEGRGADVIVRVTADDPLKDPSIIANAIAMLREAPMADYCSNSIRPTYPEGLDIEVFTNDALSRAFHEAKLPSEREHVTPYLWKNPELFSIRSLEYGRDLSHWRWTVDKPADLELVRMIYEKFRDQPLVPYTEIIAYLEQNPDLLDINAGTVRREGYLKSLAAEQK